MKYLDTLLLVRGNERARVFYFCMLFLLIGMGMAIGRSTADALFFKRYGIENLPVMYGVLSIVFVVSSIAYAAVADRFSAERIFKNIFIVLLISILGSWFLIAFARWEPAYPIYFIVYEIASELLLLHGALYVSQNFETLQSKRLSPLMFGSAQIGTIFGGLFVAGATWFINIQNIVLVWCLLLIASILLIQSHHAKKGKSPFFFRRRFSRNPIASSVQEIKQGVHFTGRSALLRAASLALFFMVMCFYIMCYTLNTIYTATFPTEAALGRFFGLLTAVTSGIALIVQFFLLGRMLRRFGIKTLNIVYPVGGILTYLGLLIFYSFPAALVGSFVREVLLPAVRRPTRNLFFTALPDYLQGRARAVSVSLVLPVALALASGVLVVFSDSINVFLIVGLVANSIYLYFAIRMNKAYVSELVGKLRDSLFLPDEGVDSMLNNCSEEILRELERGVHHADDALAVGYAKLLLAADADRFKSAIVPRLDQASIEFRDRMIKLLAGADLEVAANYCRAHMDVAEDDHLRATLLKVLIDFSDKSVVPRFAVLLNENNPRLVALGILGVFKFDVADLKDQALQRWQELFVKGGEASVAALELLVPIPEQRFYGNILDHLHSGEVRRQKLALRVLKDWPHEHETEKLESALAMAMRSLDADVRARTVECYCLLPADKRDELYLAAFEDNHIQVRETAISAMDDGTGGYDEMLCGWIIGNAGSPRAQRAILNYLSQFQIPESVLWQIVFTKTRDAEVIDSVLGSLDALLADNADANKWRILEVTLLERKKQILNLVLQALERVEPPETIQMIYAGVNSKDSRSYANAVEALSHIDSRFLARKLTNLFEGDPDENEDSHHKEGEPDLKEILDLCASRPDPWLRECVAYIKSKIAPVEAYG